jgi:hypothetical protein
LVELHRRDAEIEQRAVQGAVAKRVEFAAKRGEVGANQRDRPFEPGRKRDVRIAVEGDDPPAARCDRARVSARSESRVEVGSAGANLKRIERLGQ